MPENCEICLLVYQTTVQNLYCLDYVNYNFATFPCARFGREQRPASMLKNLLIKIWFLDAQGDTCYIFQLCSCLYLEVYED